MVALTGSAVSSKHCCKPLVPLRPHGFPTKKLAVRALAQAHSTDYASSTGKQKHLFIFGLGYTTLGFANILSKEGWSISTTCRNGQLLSGCQRKGWQAFEFDPANGRQLSEEGKAALADAPFVISSIPPLALPLYDPVLSAQQKLLKQVCDKLLWFGYLSSTGVYGDWQGDWVDETSECKTRTSRGYIRKEAEDAWIKLHQSDKRLPLHIFRLGGIYGPGRSVLDTMSKAAPLSDSQQRRGRQKYTSRCHVADICHVLCASMAAPNPGSIYNVADDEPAGRAEVMDYARSLVMPDLYSLNSSSSNPSILYACNTDPGNSSSTQASSHYSSSAAGDDLSSRTKAAGHRAAPGVSTADAVINRQDMPTDSADTTLAEGGVSSSSDTMHKQSTKSQRKKASGEALEEKRVRNERIKTELGVKLKYPTYREGVAAIHAGDCSPFEKGDLELLNYKCAVMLSD